MTKPTKEHLTLAAENRSRVALTFADNTKPFDVDGVAEELGLPREVVNLAAPWDRAELDASNSSVYRVELEGDPVVWDHRDSPDYFDDDGNPQQVVKPAYARVDLRARSDDEAQAAALATHPGFHTVRSVENLERPS